MAVTIVNEHKNMKYKVGDTVVLRKFDDSYKNHKKEYSNKTAKINEIRCFNYSETDYTLDIDNKAWCWFDEDIDHEATEILTEHKKQQTIFLTMSGRGFNYSKRMAELYTDLKNCTFKQVEPKRVIPNKGDQYLYVDLADENLYGISTWLNDSTDFHMLKLGLIKDTAQECVKVAREMLKKLELEV